MDKIFNTWLAEWDNFRHLFTQQEIPAKTILLREGDISKKAFYIQQGCIRVFFNNDGKDITFQFFFEGEGVSSIESFRTSLPSLFTIETLEPCVIHCINKKDFNTIISTSPAIKQQIEENIFQRLVLYQHLFLSRIRDNPQKRY